MKCCNVIVHTPFSEHAAYILRIVMVVHAWYGVCCVIDACLRSSKIILHSLPSVLFCVDQTLPMSWIQTG